MVVRSRSLAGFLGLFLCVGAFFSCRAASGDPPQKKKRRGLQALFPIRRKTLPQKRRFMKKRITFCMMG